MTQRRRHPIRFAAQKSDINITPLIDVLLVLIVIFMVITPVTPRGMETQIPAATPPTIAESHADDSLVLSMARDGTIHLNQEDVEMASLMARLQQIFKGRSDRTLFVQADDEVVFNQAAQLIDVARGAGATRIGLMAEKIAAQ